MRRSTYHGQFFRKTLVPFRANKSLKELVVLASLVGVLIVQSSKVFSGHRVNDLSPHAPSNLSVFVQDTVICQILVNAHQRIKKVAYVDNASRESKSTAAITNRVSTSSSEYLWKSSEIHMHSQWITKVRRICCKNDTSNSKCRRAPLLQLVRIEIGDGVLFRLRIAGQDLFPSLWLSGNVFLFAETGGITV